MKVTLSGDVHHCLRWTARCHKKRLFVTNELLCLLLPSHDPSSIASSPDSVTRIYPGACALPCSTLICSLPTLFYSLLLAGSPVASSQAGGDVVVELVVADHHLVAIPLADPLVGVVLVSVLVVRRQKVVGGDLLHLHPGRVLHRSQVLHAGLLDGRHVRLRVRVVHNALGLQLELVVAVGKVLVVVVQGDVVLQLRLGDHRGLERPATRDVALGVAAATGDHQRHLELLDEADALRVPVQRQIEAPEAVVGEGVRPTLDHHCAWLVHLHHLGENRLEEALKTSIVESIFQRDVHGVVLSSS
mmetsp:Transcript_18038/g.39401  ORF Transcript_18038/g.39401 Transcript_18038/m.39401 type:complete len:302 (+) Transcript_18038:109-1014(+)